jgi:long-chain fatty acid transport protein
MSIERRRGTRWTATFLAALAGLGVTLPAEDADAGGLFLPARGVRPVGRGGAFVAGADDLGALWYNPAGLGALIGGEEKQQLLVDFALVPHDVTYTRVDSGGNPQLPVESEGQLVPIPTIAYALDLSPRATVGFGLLAPYSGLDSYPEDGPQRYALVSLHNTAMVLLEGAVAYRVSDTLTIGAAVQNLILSFRSQVVFSGCPGQLVCAPEDPEFDAFGEIEQRDLLNPSLLGGVIWQPTGAIRLGAALQLPFYSTSKGHVRVRLPSSGFFNGAHVEGDEAKITMVLPAMLRAGLEIAPFRGVRLEAGADLETWSLHDEILVEPQNIRIEDAAAVGTYDLGPISIPRHFDNTFAARIGLEVQPVASLPLQLRAGYAYETAASPLEYLSVLTVDGNKHLLAAGLSFAAMGVRIDAAVARVLVADREVPPGTSCVPLQNPIRSGEDTSQATPGEACVHDDDPAHVYVGDGTYESSFSILGLGATLDF